jgi:hypothetical protein
MESKSKNPKKYLSSLHHGSIILLPRCRFRNESDKNRGDLMYSPPVDFANSKHVPRPYRSRLPADSTVLLLLLPDARGARRGLVPAPTTSHTVTHQGGTMSAESYVKLRNLTVREGEPVKQIVERSLDQLRGLNEKGTVHLRVSGVSAKEPTAT